MSLRSLACSLVALGVATLAISTRAAAQDDQARAQARALYESGARAYAAGDYQTAVDSFLRAYALHPQASLLFNAAQVRRQQGYGHCRDAVEYYQRYLGASPNASDRTEVDQAMAELRDCVAREEREIGPREPEPPATTTAHGTTTTAPGHPRAEAATASDTSSEARRAPVRRSEVRDRGDDSAPIGSTLGWVSIAAGGVGLAVGTTAWVLAALKRDRLEERCADRACLPPVWGDVDEYETLRAIAFVGLAVGGALALGGIGLVVLTSGTDDDARVRVGLTPRALLVRVAF